MGGASAGVPAVVGGGDRGVGGLFSAFERGTGDLFDTEGWGEGGERVGGGDQRIESEGGEPIGSEVEIDWGGWGGVGGLGDSAWGEEFFSPGDGWGAEGGSGDGGIGNGAFSEAGPTIWDGAWGSVVAFAWVDGGLFAVDRAADLFVKETFPGVMRDRFDGGKRDFLIGGRGWILGTVDGGGGRRRRGERNVVNGLPRGGMIQQSEG